MARRRRRPLRWVLWFFSAFVAVLAVEGAIATRREYLTTPTFEIRATARPSGATRASEPLRMVMLGDSTVAGLGSDTLEESLVLQTAQRVADRLGRPVDAKGLGVSGARTVDVRDQQVPQVPDDTDVIVIVIGSNDTTHLTPPWQFDDLTVSMLDAAQRQAPDAVVVLGGIPLFGEARALDQPLRWVVEGYAAVLRRVQRNAMATVGSASYVNIAVLASPRFVGVPGAMSRDQFHPGAPGYGFWADALAPAIADAVQRRQAD